MLSVETNRNIEEYKSDFAGGYDLKETLAIAVALIAGVVVAAIAYLVFHVSLYICPYIAMPVVVFIIVMKFFNRDGLGFKETIKKEKVMKSGVVLYYRSTETAESYMRLLKETEKKQEAFSDESFDKTMKLLKIGGILFAAIFIAVIVAVIILSKSH